MRISYLFLNSFCIASLHIQWASSYLQFNLWQLFFFYFSLHFFILFYYSFSLFSFLETLLISIHPTLFLKPECARNYYYIKFFASIAVKICAFPIFHYKTVKYLSYSCILLTCFMFIFFPVFKEYHYVL